MEPAVARIDVPKLYRPRRPERSTFYAVLHQFFDRFTREYEQRFDRTFGPLSCSAKRAALWAEFVREQVIRPVPPPASRLRTPQNLAAGLPEPETPSPQAYPVRLEGSFLVPP